MKTMRRLSMLTQLVWMWLAVMPAFPATVEWGEMYFDQTSGRTKILADPNNLGGSAKILKERTGITIAASGTSHSATKGSIQGHAALIDLEIPNFTNDVTANLSILDANSVVMKQTGNYNRNYGYAVIVDIPLSGTYTALITLSGASGGATTVYYTIYGR